MGVYYSRVEAISNSKGKYIILMDPDDMFLNENLLTIYIFNIVLNYNIKYNFWWNRSQYLLQIALIFILQKFILFILKILNLILKKLLSDLYNYNLLYNLDIVEFTVFREDEESGTIFYPDIHFKTHYHNFTKHIIYQPELSDILFYLPNTKNYSQTICRNIWNKMINKKRIFFKGN